VKDCEDTKRLKRLLQALDDALDARRRIPDGLEGSPHSSQQDDTPTSPAPGTTLPEDDERVP
jgi:hypothetical protein